MGKIYNQEAENLNQFWIGHNDIKVTLSLILFVSSLSLICFIFIKQNVYEVIKYNYDLLKYWRKEFYIRDKIILHGYYNMRQGILYDNNCCFEQVGLGYKSAIYKVDIKDVKCSFEAENIEDAIII